MEFQLRKIGHVVLNAFEVGSVDEVFRARAWLRARDVPIVFEGRRRAGCQIALKFRQIGTEGSVRPGSEWRPAKTLEDAVANPVKGQLW